MKFCLCYFLHPSNESTPLSPNTGIKENTDDWYRKYSVWDSNWSTFQMDVQKIKR
jgi:hypothetical protein